MPVISGPKTPLPGPKTPVAGGLKAPAPKDLGRAHQTVPLSPRSIARLSAPRLAPLLAPYSSQPQQSQLLPTRSTMQAAAAAHPVSVFLQFPFVLLDFCFT